jgi:DAK2 domain fusion protein YloV
VILSQFFRGLAKGLDGREVLSGSSWAAALSEASHAAYKGLSQPVEGTMLTVIRDAAKAAEEAARENSDDITSITEAAVKAAKESVARTPLLLPVLREAGVVDAGGQGIYVLLEGILYYLKGELEVMKYRKPELIAAGAVGNVRLTVRDGEAEEAYGYCTNFLLEGSKLNPDKIRKRLERKGRSVVVVGDENTVRVHIHTYDPGGVIRFATSLGTLHQLQIQNMDDQHVTFLEMQQERASKLEIGVVAVVSGEGLMEVFKSLGATAIVPGGQTMNPSVQEILNAVEAVPSQRVIVLPNNKNIIPAATQVQSLTSKQVAVVPSKTIPQGVAALIAFNYEGTLEENVRAMEMAIAAVKTIEITTAVRSTQIKGVKVKEGQAIAILDDSDLIAVADDVTEVLLEALEKAGIRQAEVITLYYGNGVESSKAEQVVAELRDRYPEKQIEFVFGGQPHYYYIVSVE